jgi:hypothetical protein
MMKKMLSGAVVCVVSILVSGPVFALTTYDFDALASGYYEEADFSALFTGVSFDNTGGSQFEIRSLNNGLQPDFTYPMAIINNPYNVLGDATIATFAELTDFVSITMGDFNADEDSLYLLAFDASDNQIDDAFFANPSSSYAGHTLSVSAASPSISWVKFYGVGSNNNSVFWDNFSFNAEECPPAVPEPMTLSLLGMGLAGVFGLRKRIA